MSKWWRSLRRRHKTQTTFHELGEPSLIINFNKPLSFSVFVGREAGRGSLGSFEGHGSGHPPSLSDALPRCSHLRYRRHPSLCSLSSPGGVRRSLNTPLCICYFFFLYFFCGKGSVICLNVTCPDVFDWPLLSGLSSSTFCLFSFLFFYYPSGGCGKDICPDEVMWSGETSRFRAVLLRIS